ncbi:molybdenum ABC transporter ATP-binding protein [Roseomonas elaeocarpi]|uniref:Molybdenum ABC transporter ATP-binding protein n=1 Tax=Roseomonas elaeocarpi TaxID=907779 RepID=A0ABV6JS36_9PROT
MIEVSLQHRFAGGDGGRMQEAGFAIDLAFRSPTPGVTAIFGPSGCGKSTTLAAVAGLLRPQAGRIVLDGEVLFDSAARRMVPPERRRCGVVFQDAQLFPHLSVRSNLRYGLRRAPRGAEGPALEEVVALLGIEPLLDRRPARLSGGERQRVALGRALLSRPRLLLMDEPLSALDAARKAEVLPFLARVRDRFRIPILYVTHAMDEVDALADRLVVLEAGRVLAEGTVEALAARPDLPALAGRRDAGAVIRCTLAEQLPGRGLTRLDFAGGALLVPAVPGAVGEALRIRVPARDVSVAVARPEGLSVQNILAARLEQLTPLPSGEVMLALAVGPTSVLSRVTADAAARLALREGMPLWALVKAVALSHRSDEEAAAG